MTFVSTPTAGALMRLAMTDILRSKISDLDPARHRSASRSLMHRDNGGSGAEGAVPAHSQPIKLAIDRLSASCLLVRRGFSDVADARQHLLAEQSADLG
jgi:hypothetical protein